MHGYHSNLLYSPLKYFFHNMATTQAQFAMLITVAAAMTLKQNKALLTDTSFCSKQYTMHFKQFYIIQTSANTIACHSFLAKFI